MGKKNTLLYLDEELVERAKRMDINLSQITEDALKERILPLLSSGEKPVLALDQVIDQFAERGMCHRLPFRIESVQLENIGPIQEFDASFEDVTVLVGQNAAGKTTVLEAVAHTYGRHDRDAESFLNHAAEDGQIHVTAEPDDTLISTFERQGNVVSSSTTNRCLLIDNLLARLTDENAVEVLDQLVERDEQVVLTGHRKELFKEHERVAVVELDD